MYGKLQICPTVRAGVGVVGQITNLPNGAACPIRWVAPALLDNNIPFYLPFSNFVSVRIITYEDHIQGENYE
ncbi:MAG: hypothetical protein HZB52_08530 [Chloroflexi bacterium]|nr:hypothetical protein [Chloroflexota bacterium]